MDGEDKLLWPSTLSLYSQTGTIYNSRNTSALPTRGRLGDVSFVSKDSGVTEGETASIDQDRGAEDTKGGIQVSAPQQISREEEIMDIHRILKTFTQVCLDRLELLALRDGYLNRGGGVDGVSDEQKHEDMEIMMGCLGDLRVRVRQQEDMISEQMRFIRERYGVQIPQKQKTNSTHPLLPPLSIVPRNCDREEHLNNTADCTAMDIEEDTPTHQGTTSTHQGNTPTPQGTVATDQQFQSTHQDAMPTHKTLSTAKESSLPKTKPTFPTVTHTSKRATPTSSATSHQHLPHRHKQDHVGKLPGIATNQYSANSTRTQPAQTPPINRTRTTPPSSGSSKDERGGTLSRENKSLPPLSTAESIRTVYSQKPASPVHPQKSTSSVYSQKSTSPVHPQKPTSPVYSQKSTSPVHPQKPTSPVHSQKSTSPVHSQKSASSVHPQKPTSPVHPHTPPNGKSRWQPNPYKSSGKSRPS